MKSFLFTATCAIAVLTANQSFAQDHTMHMAHAQHQHHHMSDGTTPPSVMGTHQHKKGDFMASYNFMTMDMGGNRNGTNRLSPEQVITFNNPNPGPANLRVVPTEMTMNMHMASFMYGLTDSITLMAMTSYNDNSMDHITFNMAGTARIGTFTTKSSGFGDTSVSALFPVFKSGHHTLNGHIGLSLPTGSITKTDSVLTPMGTRTTLRLPYAMQLGTGTYDVLSGLTYRYDANKWQYGADYKARFHLGRNDEGYTRGDKHKITGWAGRTITPEFGINASITASYAGTIDGQDDQIAAPVQTADPDNYGGEKVTFGLGAGWRFYDDNTLKAQFSVPLYQNLNGPQLEDDYNFTIGWQKTF